MLFEVRRSLKTQLRTEESEVEREDGGKRERERDFSEGVKFLVERRRERSETMLFCF